MKAAIFFLLRMVIFIVLPFIVLIRTSVFLHKAFHVNPWLAVIGGILTSALVLLIYVLYQSYIFTGRLGNLNRIKTTYWMVTALVFVYCAPALLFLAAGNAKGDEVKSEFTTLHPVLRLSISTLIILERDLLITDANRYPEDYRKMGLPTKGHSLHYEQSNGYVHAVDLRTKGHSWLRNTLVSTYFKLMGFNTLRHVGTADHLHISLYSHDRPGAI